MKERIGATAVIVGIIGAAFAAGAEPLTVKDWVICLGTAGSSLMLMQMGVWMINDQI